MGVSNLLELGDQRVLPPLPLGQSFGLTSRLLSEAVEATLHASQQLIETLEQMEHLIPLVPAALSLTFDLSQYVNLSPVFDAIEAAIGKEERHILV